MTVNKFKPHLMVLPEDDDNVSIANGFQLHPNLDLNAFQILPKVGGWKKVVEAFLSKSNISNMVNCPQRRMLLLIDFDGDPQRPTDIHQEISQHPGITRDVCDRVFVLGSFDEPKDVKKVFNVGLEKIGEQLAADCFSGTSTAWGRQQLTHNMGGDLNKMIQDVRPFLFK